MRIRPFEESDRPAVIELWRACNLTRPWNDPDTDISFCLDASSATLLVGEETGAILGTVMVGHDGHRGWVYYLATEPSRQRQGIGRLLMQAAEAWALKRGVPKLMLMVRPENASVRSFYERLGYGEEPRIIFSRKLGAAP